MVQASSEADGAFDAAVHDLLARNPNPFFVQVGGYDGVSFDPLRPHVVANDLSGIIVEPVPAYFEKLQTLYAGSGRVRPINCAVAEEDGERTIYRFQQEAVETGILPPHFGGISSFLMEDLLAETGVLGRSSPSAHNTELLRTLVEPVPVKARTLNSLLSELAIERVDILQIDTEGYDFRVLQLFDFTRHQPVVVHYEHQHLSAEDRASAEALLRGHGYRIHPEKYDTLAVRDGTAAKLEVLRELGELVQSEGRHGQAITIFEYVARIEPDARSLLALVRALCRADRHFEALSRLPALRDAGATAPVVAEIETIANWAVDILNAHLRRGDMAAAEPYASALVALAPKQADVLEVALDCNMKLGRREAAARHAEALLALDPGNAEARKALAALAESAEPAPARAAAGRRPRRAKAS